MSRIQHHEDDNDTFTPPSAPPSPPPPTKPFSSRTPPEIALRKSELCQSILEDIRSYTDFQILPLAQHLSLNDIEHFFEIVEETS